MQLSVLDDLVELEGTHKVVIHTTAATESGDLVVLKHEDVSCGAVVGKIRHGKNDIAMDKFLRIHLRARLGDVLEVEFATPSTAQRIELLVPVEYEREGLAALVRDSLLGKPLCVGQAVPLFMAPLTGEQAVGQVAVCNPDGIVLVARSTELLLRAGKVSTSGITYADIGGLVREIQRIREIVEYPIRHPEVFRRLGIAPPRGVLLHGPPGTGKTLIAKALAHEVGASVHAVQGPEIMSGYYGGSEQNLRHIFEQARDNPPAIILIDEVDSIAPRRDQTRGEVEHRVVATLLSLMDGLSELKDTVVIGTTNAINTIDPALRRPGRFEHEIHVGVPDTRGRREILAIHTRRMPLGGDVDLDVVAEKTHGFSGADLSSLCREAAYGALRRLCGGEPNRLLEVASIESLQVQTADFAAALGSIKPSAMREVLVEIPTDISWDSIGGLADVKQLIVENVVYGIRKRDAFVAVGIKPARGMLLYGPPGTGKTLLAKVVARESGANFIAVRGPEVRSKWFGESEEKIRFIFSKAREVAPCVIFFDEMDAIAPPRGREASAIGDPIVNQLLSEMDGIEKTENLFVIAATNRPELIDPALLRPGRFDYQVHVDLPDQEARARIFEVHLRNKPVDEHVEVGDLAGLTRGFSGADICEACRLATLDALRTAGFEPAGVRVTPERLHRAIEALGQTMKKLSRAPLGFHTESKD